MFFVVECYFSLLTYFTFENEESISFSKRQESKMFNPILHGMRVGRRGGANIPPYQFFEVTPKRLIFLTFCVGDNLNLFNSTLFLKFWGGSNLHKWFS